MGASPAPRNMGAVACTAGARPFAALKFSVFPPVRGVSEDSSLLCYRFQVKCLLCVIP